MHYRHHDNASIVRDYYKQMTHELLRKALIDVNDDNLIDENITLLVSRTAMKAEDIKDNIIKLQNIQTDTDIVLSDQETKRLIDFINNVLKEF